MVDTYHGLFERTDCTGRSEWPGEGEVAVVEGTGGGHTGGGGREWEGGEDHLQCLFVDTAIRRYSALKTLYQRLCALWTFSRDF